MVLLPFNRILAVTHARFAIYEIGPFAADTGRAPFPPPSKPLWSHVYWRGHGDFFVSQWQPAATIDPHQVYHREPGIISISTYYRDAVRKIHIPTHNVSDTTVETIKVEEAKRNVYDKKGSMGQSQGFRWTTLRQPLSKFEATFMSWRPSEEVDVIRQFGGLPYKEGRCKSGVELLQTAYKPPECPSRLEMFFEERSGRLILPVLRKRVTVLIMDYA